MKFPKLSDERTRGYIYRVLVSAGTVAVFYGLLTGDELVVWLALAGTVLGNGLAAANSSIRRP